MRGPDRIGKYLVEKALGAGSFATVWLAFDELLETRVAIKVLADNWSRSTDIRQRFIGEARILRRIDHDRIVRVHDVDELPDGRPYFVMAWADGGSLHERIQSIRESGRLMPVTEALSLAIEVCDALSIVHDYGVVHRDVKPSNVLFRSVRNHERAAAAREGRLIGDQAVMLGDFGLAKDVAAASGFTLAAGTPAYMAPEQARASDNIDRRVDVFAAAAVLYELLTGAPAFSSGTLSGVRRREGSTTIPLLADRRDGLDPALQQILEAGMATDPERRTGSATKLGDQLREVLQRVSAPRPAPRGAGTVVGAEPPQLAPPPSASRPSLQPVGAAGRVKDLMMTARAATLTPEGLAMLETADQHLTRPLVVTAVTSGFPEAFSAAWALLGLRPAQPTVVGLAGSVVTIRRGLETVGVASNGATSVALTVDFDDQGDVVVAAAPGGALRGSGRSSTELTIDSPGRRDIELQIVPDLDLASDEVADCDLLVMFVDDDAEAARPTAGRAVEILKPSPAGPIAIETLVIVGSAGAEAAGAVSSSLATGTTVLTDADVMSSTALSRLRGLAEELAEQRGSVVRAAAGLALLVGAAQHAAPGPTRTKLFEEIDNTRIELPMLSELDTLRDLAAGRLTLPKPVRRIVRPLFLHAGVTARLGIDRNSDERQVQQAVERVSGELRTLENTGRVPFTARKAVLLAQQSLDRIHAELAPYL